MIGQERASLELLRIDWHQIGKARSPGCADELGLQNIGIADVSAFDIESLLRGDGPVASPLAVKQCPENRGTIKSWPTKPVDRAALRNQSCRPAVTDKAILLDLGNLVGAELHNYKMTNAGPDDAMSME